MGSAHRLIGRKIDRASRRGFLLWLSRRKAEFIELIKLSEEFDVYLLGVLLEHRPSELSDFEVSALCGLQKARLNEVRLCPLHAIGKLGLLYRTEAVGLAGRRSA